MTAVSWDIAIGVAFLVGVLLFGISTAMLRSARAQNAPLALPEAAPEPPPLEAPRAPEPEPEPVPLWPQLIDGDLKEADAAARAEIVERLAIVGTAWSRDVLERANREERDPAVLAAIERALNTPAQRSYESTGP